MTSKKQLLKELRESDQKIQVLTLKLVRAESDLEAEKGRAKKELKAITDNVRHHANEVLKLIGHAPSVNIENRNKIVNLA